MKDYGCGLVMADGSFCESFEGTLNLCSHCNEAFLKRVEKLENAQQSMHLTAFGVGMLAILASYVVFLFKLLRKYGGR